MYSLQIFILLTWGVFSPEQLIIFAKSSVIDILSMHNASLNRTLSLKIIDNNNKQTEANKRTNRKRLAEEK